MENVFFPLARHPLMFPYVSFCFYLLQVRCQCSRKFVRRRSSSVSWKSFGRLSWGSLRSKSSYRPWRTKTYADNIYFLLLSLFSFILSFWQKSLIILKGHNSWTRKKLYPFVFSFLEMHQHIRKNIYASTFSLDLKHMTMTYAFERNACINTWVLFSFIIWYDKLTFS